MSAKFITWNVQGLNDLRKVRKVFAYLRRHCVDITLLQEMHLMNSTQHRLLGGWVHESALSNYSAYARGVAILVRKGLEWRAGWGCGGAICDIAWDSDVQEGDYRLYL